MTPEQKARRRAYMAGYRLRPGVIERERVAEAARRAALTPEDKARLHEQRRLWTQRQREAGIHTVTLLPRTEYERLLRSQRGGCAICHHPETTVSAKGRVRRLSIDHDHGSGKPRALLCSRCNSAIALMRDDPAIAVAAADYLRWHRKRAAADKMQEALG